MSDENKNIKAYEQACSTLRLYSNSSFATRIVSIVQGLILLTAWFTVKNNYNDSVLPIFISSFGIAFTVLLFFFHKGYWDALNFLYDHIAQMEENLFDEGFRPHSMYNKAHVKKYERPWKRILIIYAPFTLIAISFVMSLIFSLRYY